MDRIIGFAERKTIRENPKIISAKIRVKCFKIFCTTLQNNFINSSAITL